MEEVREHALHVIFTCPLRVAIVHKKHLVRKNEKKCVNINEAAHRSHYMVFCPQPVFFFGFNIPSPNHRGGKLLVLCTFTLQLKVSSSFYFSPSYMIIFRAGKITRIRPINSKFVLQVPAIPIYEGLGHCNVIYPNPCP